MNKHKTKTIFRIGFILTSIASLFFVPCLLVKAWILPLPDTIQAQLDEAVDYGFTGMVVFIDQKGKTPQALASGWHNKETKLQARPNALFKIGSIGKLYDAVAVTKLVNSGLLSLDNTLAELLPELNGRIENADRITLREMIQHRSGIPNYTDSPRFWEAPTQTYEESLALILDKPANFKPGEDYEYCNTNYLLLNEIMDQTLGYENFEFIQAEILDPLGLQNTYGSLKGVKMKNMMSGYHIGHPYDLKSDDFGMVATAEDVGAFLRALNDGTLLTSEEQDLYSSVYKYEHAGWVPGYQSFAEYHEDIDAVVVVFYSTTDPDLLYWNLSEIINGRIVKILKKQDE